MSQFNCVCGAVTRDDEEPSGASRVAYAIDELNEIEARIAHRITEFLAARDGGNRAEWIESNFENGWLYPAEEPDRGVIEDIISGGLNEGFTPRFRCPACGRIAMKDTEAGHWVFCSPERNEGHD
jgi:hypothetical protein